MRLKRLEINGFKSFGKKTAFDFDSPITAIVGPNGSGKSNVAESLRWVLGEQSMKSLRGKRGEDLIFSGSNSAPRQNRASVSLVFDNSSTALGTGARPFPGIEFDEVAFEREVQRDGSNTYSVNGSQVRLRDVMELLSAVSLGPSGHHIISQGEADRVLNANPRERREILEEALGLKIYQFKIAESSKRLEKTQENVKQVESLRREIAPHLKFLKKQVEEAQKVVAMKDELAMLAVEYFVAEGAYLDELERGIKSETHTSREKLVHVEKELSAARRALEEADRETGGKNPKLTELENAIANARKDKDEASRLLGRLEGKIESTKVEEFVLVDKTTGKHSCRYCGQEIQRSDLKGSQGPTSGSGHLLEEKAKLENKLHELSKKEKELIDELDALRVALSSKSEEARVAERRLYELKSEEASVRAELEKLALRESSYKNEKEVFARDAHEVSMLTGKNVLGGAGGEASGKSGDLASGTREAQQDKRKRLERLKIKVEDAGGVGTDVVREFEETSARDEHLATELADLEKSATSLTQLMSELRETLEVKFKTGLNAVNEEFDKYFAQLFGGGKAALSVLKMEKREKIIIDGEEMEVEAESADESPSESQWGIDITVSLPKKKIKGLEMLSGGERALTSIALIFALSQVNPPPFLVLDETDAALDEANSRRYGEILSLLSSKSQLIVITHNRETMSHAQVLYGVTMSADSISKLLSIRFEEAQVFAK
ncbi:MAG TPA: AAA family ATPase [Candidatus Paceibacterota bacterium]